MSEADTPPQSGQTPESNHTPDQQTETTTGPAPSDGETESESALDPRTRRAREEDMDVSLLEKGGLYEVRSQSGSTYEVDVIAPSCTCPDWQQREPTGGCKHIRRVDFEIKAEDVPRPDGRLPERLLTDGRGGDIDACATRIAERLDTIKTEIERLQNEQESLESALGVIEQFRGDSHNPDEEVEDQ